MELIRAILLETEALSPGDVVCRMNGYDDAAFAYNVDLMDQAGLVDAAVATAAGHGPVQARVYALTWAGHDFLDAVRSDSIWARTKATVAEAAGSVTFDALKQVAVAIALKAATSHI